MTPLKKNPLALQSADRLSSEGNSKGESKNAYKQVISSRGREKFGVVHCLSGCLLLAAVLVHCSTLSSASLAKKGDVADQLAKEFNLAFSNFVKEFKSKNPQFNLSSVKIDDQLQKQREKREVSLEEELEYALKNKKQAGLFGGSNYNSLEVAEEPPSEESTCLNCKPNESLRKRRIEQIKKEILRKLNLEQAPQVNISAIPRQMILNNFLNDPMYQNDQSFEEYINDDEEIQVKQVITFAEKGRLFCLIFDLHDDPPKLNYHW